MKDANRKRTGGSIGSQYRSRDHIQLKVSDEDARCSGLIGQIGGLHGDIGRSSGKFYAVRSRKLAATALLIAKFIFWAISPSAFGRYLHPPEAVIAAPFQTPGQTDSLLTELRAGRAEGYAILFNLYSPDDAFICSAFAAIQL
jgi:hypothetical protein